MSSVPSLGAVLGFLAASLVLVLVPGPSVLFIVGRALAHGRRAALTSFAGNTVGVAVLVVLVAAGLGAVAAASAAVFTAVKFVGAAYLVYLGVQTFRRRGELRLDAPGGPVGRRVFLQGVVVGLTNPKALVFFAAVLPQFLGPQAPNPTVQLLVFGLLFCLTAAVLDSTWGLVAGTARDWFATSPARLRLVGGTGGVVLVGMGAGLALTGQRAT